MFNLESYLSRLIDSLQDAFGARLAYVGLQGSYLRGEATDTSDIDIMAVIDELTVDDLDTYRRIIEAMECFDRSCGFICSRSDLSNWNPLEIAHVLHSTRDYYGTLREMIPDCTQEDVRNFVKMSLNNLYHEICHRYIHAERSRSAEALPFVYKGTFFILQNLYYLRNGQFIATKAELLPLLEGKDRDILQHAMDFKAGIDHDFRESFELLFTWCQETLKSL